MAGDYASQGRLKTETEDKRGNRLDLYALVSVTLPLFFMEQL